MTKNVNQEQVGKTLKNFLENYNFAGEQQLQAGWQTGILPNNRSTSFNPYIKSQNISGEVNKNVNLSPTYQSQNRNKQNNTDINFNNQT